MDDNDPIVVLNRAATAPEGGWHVFPMQAGSVLIWVVKRFLWSLLLTVLVALGVVALEFVAIDDPRLPLMLLGALGVWALLLCSGPLRVLFGGRHNLLVITPELVVWRLGSHVVSLPLAEVKAIREHMTTGRGYSYAVTLDYGDHRKPLIEHKHFGAPFDIAGALARQLGLTRDQPTHSWHYPVP